MSTYFRSVSVYKRIPTSWRQLQHQNSINIGTASVSTLHHAYTTRVRIGELSGRHESGSGWKLETRATGYQFDGVPDYVDWNLDGKVCLSIKI